MRILACWIPCASYAHFECGLMRIWRILVTREQALNAFNSASAVIDKYTLGSAYVYCPNIDADTYAFMTEQIFLLVKKVKFCSFIIFKLHTVCPRSFHHLWNIFHTVCPRSFVHFMNIFHTVCHRSCFHFLNIFHTVCPKSFVHFLNIFHTVCPRSIV